VRAPSCIPDSTLRLTPPLSCFVLSETPIAILDCRCNVQYISLPSYEVLSAGLRQDASIATCTCRTSAENAHLGRSFLPPQTQSTVVGAGIPNANGATNGPVPGAMPPPSFPASRSNHNSPAGGSTRYLLEEEGDAIQERSEQCEFLVNISALPEYVQRLTFVFPQRSRPSCLWPGDPDWRGAAVVQRGAHDRRQCSVAHDDLHALCLARTGILLDVSIAVKGPEREQQDSESDAARQLTHLVSRRWIGFVLSVSEASRRLVSQLLHLSQPRRSACIISSIPSRKR
jgi:hypothetical protein